MAFLSKSTEYDGNYWGLAPHLTHSTWGAYDTGFHVFTQYEGGSPQGLTHGWDNFTLEGGTWDKTHGYLKQTATTPIAMKGGPAALIESTTYSATGSYILESAFNYSVNAPARVGIMAVASNNNSDPIGYRFMGENVGDTADSITFLNDLVIFVTTGTYTSEATNTNYTMQIVNSAGTWTGNLFSGTGVTGTAVATLASTIYSTATALAATSGYVGVSAAYHTATNNAQPNPMNVQWFRMRALPPSNTMPTVSSITSGTLTIPLSDSLTLSATVSTTSSIKKSLYDSVTLVATASTIKGRSSSLYDSVTLVATASTTSSIKKSLYDSVTLADTASTTSSIKKSLYDSVTLADTASTTSSLNKSLYDSVTLSDTVQARPTTKQLYDSMTLADSASTTASINKSLDDSMTLADTASTTASINKSLDDSMALADTASTTASINKSLDDSMALADSASTTASINKSLDDSMALADTASTTSSINKSLDDSMALADTASTTSSFNKSLDDSMALADTSSTTSSFNKSLDDSMALADTASTTSSFNKSLDDSMALADTSSTTSSFNKSLDDSMALADTASTTSSLNKSLYDSVTLADTSSTTSSFNKSLDDSMALADSASTTSSINKSLYDSMALADSYSSAKSFRKSLYDSVTLADSTSAAASLNKPLYDSVTLDDTASTSASINKSLDDSMALADSASTTASINKSLYDSMALADSYSSAKSFRKSLYDSVTLADSTSAAASLNKPLYDSVTLADSASTTSSINKSLDDSMALADSASTTSSINKSLYDSMALADSYSSAKSFRKSLYDSVTLADSTSAAASLNKPLYDSVTLADSASTTSSINKSLDDSMALADSASTTSSINKSLDDSMALADSTSTSASINKSLYDSMALADSYSSAKSFRKSLYDSVTLADSASAAASLNKPLYDSVTLDDTASTSASINKSLYDSMALADSYSSAKSFRKSLYDSVTLADTASTLVNKSLYDSMTLSDTVQARPTTKQLYDSMTLADSVSALKPSLSSLTFDPTSGPVGSTITISGTNFIGNTLVTITLPDGSTTTVTTFATGSFTKIVTMPSAPGVAHTIPATDGTNTASFPFKITPTITVSPSSGSVGDTVTLSGTGYAANSLVTITLPDGNTTTVTTDSKGSFTKIITMPSAPAGINPISGTDGTNTASSSFTINAKTTVSPSSGNVGDTVTISETGFKANSLVTITLPDGSTITGTTNATGSLTKIITIPSSTGGAHTISGTDGTNTAGSSFTINAKTTVSPTSGAPGSSATVSGTGYKANSLVTITLPDGSTTTATTDSKGSFTKIITIPISTTTGLHTIHATDGTNTASSSFVASLATITLTPPASGPVGSTVTVSGSNFRANQAITIKYGGSTVTTIPSPVTTNGAGSFSGVTFAAPSTSAAGHNNVTATDTINQASANFTATGVAQSLTPSPSSGSVGDTVTLSGTGFAWGDTVTITLPDGNTTTATTDSKGSFTKQVIMPSAPAGINPISATDQHSNTASSSFTINAKTTVSPSSGSVGDTVTISETGFKANSLVTITLPDGSTITGTTDATGSLTKIITMPSSTGGAHTISGTDGTNTAGSSFTINAKTTISPTSGGVGSLATLSGTGYKANSLVTITLPDGNTVTATTDSTGSFTKIITIPSTISGDHTISTTDGTNHASSTFTIVTAPPQPTLKISYATGTQVTPSIGPTWNSAGNGGSAITNYTLYRSLPDQPGTELLLTTVSSSTTSYTDSSVRTGHMYYYQVTAWNAIGESVKSTEAGGEVFDISSTNNVTATDPILSIHITPTTTSAKINYQTSGNVTLSHPLQITANNTYGNYAVSIPAGITISGSGWNGILSMPLPLPTTSVTAPSGTTVDSVISLGFSGATLTFDKPVEIVFSGDAGKRVGFSSNGGPLTEITTACLSDTSSAIPGGSHECKINSGSDLHVWTLHFTSYSIFSSAGGGGAVTSSVTSGGGAGGVGMGPSTGPSTSVGNFTGVQESNLKILDVSYDTCTTNMVKILVAYSDNSPSVILRTSITGVVSATPAQVQPFEIENQNATIQRLVYEAPINNKEQTFEVLALQAVGDNINSVGQTIGITGCQGETSFENKAIVPAAIDNSAPRIFDVKFQIDNSTKIPSVEDNHFVDSNKSIFVSAIVDSKTALDSVELRFVKAGDPLTNYMSVKMDVSSLPISNSTYLVTGTIPSGMLQAPALTYWINADNTAFKSTDSDPYSIGIKPIYSIAGSLQLDIQSSRREGTTSNPTAYFNNNSTGPVYGSIVLISDGKTVYTSPSQVFTPGQNLINLIWYTPTVGAIVQHTVQARAEIYDQSFETVSSDITTFPGTFSIPLSNPQNITSMSVGNMTIAKVTSLYSSFVNNGTMEYKVTAPDGTCVIGVSDNCLVSNSTLGLGGNFKSIQIGDQIFRVRYAGSDSPLERFSITSVDPITGIWKVEIDSKIGHVPSVDAMSHTLLKVKYREFDTSRITIPSK